MNQKIENSWAEAGSLPDSMQTYIQDYVAKALEDNPNLTNDELISQINALVLSGEIESGELKLDDIKNIKAIHAYTRHKAEHIRTTLAV